MTLPLNGLRILAVEQYGAGPFGTQHLADLGAEVIKIENPAQGGDVGRQVGPLFFDEGDSHFHQSFNRNKKSITLDLKTDKGREEFRALVQTADAVFNNLRGDLPEVLGLDFASLCGIKPDIVCAHLSAYGRDGERKNWPGYDYLMQAEAGYMSLTGEPESPPARFGLSVVDMMTGTTAALALVSAVLGARTTGKGRDIDVSLYDVAMHNLSYVATWYLNDSMETGRQPRSAHPSLVPSQLYRTRDGWIFIMCNKEKFFPVLCDALGLNELSEDARFCDFPARLQNRDALTEILDEAFMARDTADWMTRLGGRIPAAPVYDVAHALDSDFARKRGAIAEQSHPARGRIKTPASPIRCPGEELPQRPAPPMGADNAEILGEYRREARGK